MSQEIAQHQYDNEEPNCFEFECPDCGRAVEEEGRCRDCGRDEASLSRWEAEREE